MEEENSVEVTLKDGKTLNFTYKTSLQKAAQVIALLTDAGLNGAPGNLVNNRPTGAARSAAGSALEAVRQSDAQTYPQKIAALGQFVVTREGRETFDPNEVLALLKRMGDTPRNYARDLRNAELLGYIQKEPNGEFYLTELASEEVSTQFANARPATRSKKRRARKQSEKKEKTQQK